MHTCTHAQLHACPHKENDYTYICHTHPQVVERFYLLALAATRRTARLCAAPEALAVWALDALKLQAEAALKFGGRRPWLRLHCGDRVRASAEANGCIDILADTNALTHSYTRTVTPPKHTHTHTQAYSHMLTHVRMYKHT